MITATDMSSVFQAVLAYLLAHDLMRYELVFITDGARSIKNGIELYFKFHGYTIILDWYHLKKKCSEYLSMGIRGTAKRNEVLQTLLRYLWVGNVDDSIAFIHSLPDTDIKNCTRMQDLVDYLERKGDFIVCYAIRKALHLRNASAIVEKSNDLLVAQRQKHNGMSWTPHGSGALAAIEMVFRNGQAGLWFRKKHLAGFSFEDLEGELCA